VAQLEVCQPYSSEVGGVILWGNILWPFLPKVSLLPLLLSTSLRPIDRGSLAEPDSILKATCQILIESVVGSGGG
jgi:hypothetical protein